MRFLGLLTGQKCSAASFARPGLLEKVARLMDDFSALGEPLADDIDVAAPGARVTLSAGRFTIRGNTLSQAAECGVSYGVFDVDSLAEAVAWTKCFLQAIGEGECEIRPLDARSDYALA
jgi:hypothetical protein